MLTDKERQVLESQREIDWLEKQIQQCEVELDKAQVPDDPDRLHLDDVRDNLNVMTQFNLIKDRVTQSVDASHFVQKALYPEGGPVAQLIHQRDDLVVSVLRSVERLREIKDELSKAQAGIIERHGENRRLMVELNKATAPDVTRHGESLSTMPGDDFEQLQQQVYDVQNRLEITRNVLTGLILESNLDWASDERWLETVQRLGNELD